jgi:bla regulator protein blaR1
VSSAFIGLVVLAAVHLVVASALSVGVAAAFPALDRALLRLDPRRRAERTFALALLPPAGGLAAALGLALPAWVLCEPRGAAEEPGLAVLALALATAILATARLGAALLAQWRTSRLVQRFRTRGRDLPGLAFEATRFPHALPVAALAGLIRPRLLLSELLLRALSPAELRAVVAHEKAHASARDNLKRLLLRASPDPLALLPAGSRLRASFEQAAEAAADQAACSDVAPLVLARALLKVAALVPPGRRLELGVAALHREGEIAARVRALVLSHEGGASDAHERAPGARRWPLPVAAGVLAAAWASLPAVHHLLETLVHLLS